MENTDFLFLQIVSSLPLIARRPRESGHYQPVNLPHLTGIFEFQQQKSSECLWCVQWSLGRISTHQVPHVCDQQPFSQAFLWLANPYSKLVTSKATLIKTCIICQSAAASTGDAPTIFEWSTILSRLILGVLRFVRRRHRKGDSGSYEGTCQDNVWQCY